MIVGIDLGTTNSLITYFSEEGPKVIPNRFGENLTPSVVSIDQDGQVYVGKTAIERMSLYPDTVAATFKRSMGTEREYMLSGKSYRAEELSSFVLRALKEDAEAFLGEEVTEAVVSVPAYFDDTRKKATKRAGEIAGLKVERIISEPTAAAVAYGLYEKEKDTRFLVFDLGGGTFDVSVLELYHNILEVRAVAGNNFLGGEDFTRVLMEMVIKKNKLNEDDLDEKTQVRIYRACEEAKKKLDKNTTVTVEFMMNDEVVTTDIRSSEFEEATEGLLMMIREPVRKSLADAGLKLVDIDEVLLIGGSTKLYLIREFVAKLFRKFPDTSINPDEAVGIGAGIQAAMKERVAEVKEVILTDVCSFTLGTSVAYEYEEDKFEYGHFAPIIERNTVIPVSRTERFYTIRDDVDEIDIKVYQGESRYVKNNLYLGELNIKVPKAKRGVEPVDVTYTYDINSLLEVEAKVVSTGKTERIIIKGAGNTMTDEEAQKRIEELSYLKISPREYEENKFLLFRAERMYEEALGDERKLIDRYLSAFDSALNSKDDRLIEKTRDSLKEILSSLQ
ncbi:MAG: molecular chaperone HscC [Pseudobutyrivibrio sp.]|nr:molecular chaperone HscC [Pseudobutyrivibrio sp.]